MKSGLYRAINWTYRIVTGSLWFWIYLIRFGLIYGFIKSAYYLKLYLSEPEYKDYTFKDIPKKASFQLRFDKVASFIISVCVITTISIFLILQKYKIATSNLLSFIWLMALIFTLLSILFAILLINYYATYHDKILTADQEKGMYAIVIKNMVSYPISSIITIGLLSAAILIAYTGLPIFILFIPGLITVSVNKMLNIHLEQTQHRSNC